jgi:hypothetical protein
LLVMLVGDSTALGMDGLLQHKRLFDVLASAPRL